MRTSKLSNLAFSIAISAGLVACDLPVEMRDEQGAAAVRAELAVAAECEEAARAEAERESIRSLIARHRVGGAERQAELTALVQREAHAVGLDPLMVAAVIARESSFRTAVVSSAGAVGLMQLRPWVAQDLAYRNDLDWHGVESLHEPHTNVRLGVLFLGELIDRFDGDTRTALAAYHRGPTRVSRQMRAGTFGASRYADDVLELQAYMAARASRREVKPGDDAPMACLSARASRSLVAVREVPQPTRES